MRFLVIAAVVWAGGCLRIIDRDDDDEVADATGDATPLPDGAWDQDCSVPLPCPPPPSSGVSVCGWIRDAESDAVVAAENPTRQMCTAITDTGPCSLRVRYFDALDFAGNPTTAQPLTPETSMVDDCGRFRALNMPRPSFGFLAIAVDDAPGITPVVPHRLTSIAFSNAEASPGIVRAYTTRVSTDAIWSMSSSVGGMTFAERGALVKVFTYRGLPRANVTVRRSGETISSADFYFSEAGITRTTIDPQRTYTGPSGSVLVIDSPTPVAHDGVGGEPAGCVWPANLGASTPGVVSFDLVEAETPAGAPCP